MPKKSSDTCLSSVECRTNFPGTTVSWADQIADSTDLNHRYASHQCSVSHPGTLHALGLCTRIPRFEASSSGMITRHRRDGQGGAKACAEFTCNAFGPFPDLEFSMVQYCRVNRKTQPVQRQPLIALPGPQICLNNKAGDRKVSRLQATRRECPRNSGADHQGGGLLGQGAGRRQGSSDRPHA